MADENHLVDKENATSSNLLSCEFCSEKAKSYSLLRLHFLTEHNIEQLQCAYCKKFFARPDSLSRHEQTAHVFKQVRYPCQLCSSHFSYECNLTRHLATVHLGSDTTDDDAKQTRQHIIKAQNLHCEFCPRLFQTRAGLASHVRSNHQLRDSPSSPDVAAPDDAPTQASSLGYFIDQNDPNFWDDEDTRDGHW